MDVLLRQNNRFDSDCATSTGKEQRKQRKEEKKTENGSRRTGSDRLSTRKKWHSVNPTMDWLKSLVKPTLAKTECWNSTRTPLAVAKLRASFKAYHDTKGEQVRRQR
jgi:hypothetical protein